MPLGRVIGMNASGKFGHIATGDGRVIFAPSLPPGLQVGTCVQFEERTAIGGLVNAVNVLKAPESQPPHPQPPDYGKSRRKRLEDKADQLSAFSVVMMKFGCLLTIAVPVVLILIVLLIGLASL